MIDPQLLARAGPFATLAMPALDALAARATERAFTPNEMLFHAGAPARGLFVVTEGRVRVLRAMAGRQHVVHVEGVGGTLGEVPLFAGGGFPATAIAAEPTRCVIIGRDAIGAAIASDPAVAWVLLERLALRVRELVDRLDRFAGQSVTSRLATLILERDGGRGRPLTLGGSQLEVAEELGTVREVIVRALRTLRAGGTVRSAGRGRFIVADAEALRRIAAGDGR